MILLVDLDDTLVDRDLAFATWAHRFLGEHGAHPGDLGWLRAADDHGLTPRAQLAAALKERMGLRASVADVVDQLLSDHVQDVVAHAGVPEALGALSAAGAVVVVVTNGTIAQQRLKLELTGLLDLVDDVVISQAVGAEKPDPSIFLAALAAASSHGGSGPGWMVGDHPVADIAGAQGCGLRTGWVSHHRPWGQGPPPDVTAPATADVLAQIT